jgi:pimeloyl-ACP methyl ester carboxylesterase
MRLATVARHLAPGSHHRLVGVHGVGLDSSTMKDLHPSLEVFDLPGHGKGVQLEQYTLVDAFNALEQQVGTDRVVLIGHSLGGYLSLRFGIMVCCLFFPCFYCKKFV